MANAGGKERFTGLAASVLLMGTYRFNRRLKPTMKLRFFSEGDVLFLRLGFGALGLPPKPAQGRCPWTPQGGIAPLTP